MDLMNRNLRILNITSWSMNGAVASIILKAYYKNCKTIFTTYRTLSEKMISDEKSEYDCVIFTNIAPIKNREFYLRMKKPLVIFDHHENANWWKEQKNNAWHVNGDYSGAMMVYLYYKRWMTDLERFKEIAFFADDFELWKLTDNKSFFFNTLFWLSNNPSSFLERWKNGIFKITDEEKNLLTSHVDRWKKFYEELPQLELKKNGRFLTANEFHSEISKQMDIEGVAYFLVYHPKSNYITIRSHNALINCQKILSGMKVFTASSNVGIIPCRDGEEAKEICKRIENIIDSSLHY